MFASQVWKSLGALWLEEAASGHLGPLSHKAAVGLSQVSFGNFFSQSTISKRGNELYGQCLVAVAAELARTQGARPDLLLPVLILLMHAVSFKEFQNSPMSEQSLIGTGDRV